MQFEIHRATLYDVYQSFSMELEMAVAVNQEHKMMVRIPRELHQAFVWCVREQDQKVSQVVRGLMMAYLDANGVTVHLDLPQDDVNTLVEGAQ